MFFASACLSVPLLYNNLMNTNLPPWLEPVPDAKYSEVEGAIAGVQVQGVDLLANYRPFEGSAEALRRQQKLVEQGWPLEVKLAGSEIVFRLIPPGEFMMGVSAFDEEAYPDEFPPHMVRFARPFYFGRFPVTQGQWEAVTGANPSLFLHCEEAPLRPVEQVSWRECQYFLELLRARSGANELLRLPSEAEWEYAVRAGTTAERYGPYRAVVWDEWFSNNTTLPVGRKMANAWGIHDAIGSVHEWCQDNWHPDYYHAPADGSAWLGADPARVVRGGSWSSNRRNCRVSYRTRFGEYNKYFLLGVRLAIGPLPA